MTLGDIEDLTKELTTAATDDEAAINFKVRVHPRYRKEDLEDEAETKDEDTSNPNTTTEYRSFLPGKYSIYLKTWGCTHNSSDSEYMAGLLSQAGYRIVEDRAAADLWLLNSCTVKNPAEDHFRNEITAATAAGKRLVVAGCVPQSDYRKEPAYLRRLSIIGVQQIDKVVEVVEQTLQGNTVRYLSMAKDRDGSGRKTGGASLAMPKVRRNPLVEILSINTGCLNECTYCKTKHARGKLGSYRPEEIVSRAVAAFAEGVRELWITSEDTGAYGRDIGTNLPALLNELVKVIPSGCRLRIGMTNPPYILEHLEAMAAILRHPRVYAFLHIPVQAGADEVLADMKRQYCIDDFCTIVDFLKQRVEGITIATDIICGFPTETAANFEESLRLIERYRFPGPFHQPVLPAAGHAGGQDAPRAHRGASSFQAILPYEGRVGARYRGVLITEEAADGRHLVGHNKCYEQILLEKGAGNGAVAMGALIDEVEIVSTGKYYMIGRPISPSIISKLMAKVEQHQHTNLLFTASAVLLAAALLYRGYRHFTG
ncbi:Threonylcarbamoyladenosine tRNA methylthiotransferase [Tyrophagus putrescentiae]|nr:Threonylcarbamoyladenosine tRNA methylthiotransferase [Tyrophagus putrescentiae]